MCGPADARPDDHDAAILREGVEVVGEVHGTDELEQHVGSDATGRLGDGGDEVLVGERLGAERLDGRPGTVAPDHAEHARAADEADLTGGAADPAGRAVDEQCLARDETGLASDRVVGSHEALGDRCDRLLVERVGSRREVALGCEHAARETAAADESEHAVSRCEPEDPGAARDDRPADLEPRNVGRPARRGGIAPLALLHVGGIEPRVASCDQHLALARFGIGPLLDADDLVAAGSAVDHCSHARRVVDGPRPGFRPGRLLPMRGDMLSLTRPSTSGPPAPGDVVVVRLPRQREIATGVLESSGRHVWLDLPPVVHAGARLDLLWGSDGGARAAVATVLPARKGRVGLALSLGDVYAVERRVLERWRPRQPLTAQVAASSGDLLSGPVINLSLGGFAARLDRAVDARTPVDATLLDSHGRPIVLAVEAEVRRCRCTGPGGRRVCRVRRIPQARRRRDDARAPSLVRPRHLVEQPREVGPVELRDGAHVLLHAPRPEVEVDLRTRRPGSTPTASSRTST